MNIPLCTGYWSKWFYLSFSSLAREYLPMGGSIKMIEESLKLAYGDNSEFIKDKRIAAVQALSGTGACRLFAAFQQRFHPDSQIYIPTPTWSKWVFQAHIVLWICSCAFVGLHIFMFSFRNIVSPLSSPDIYV